ncbi:MAG: TlpA family protein disulfide reductase [Alcanivorax sp.]
MKDQIAFEKMEAEAFRVIKTGKKYENDVYLPQMQVAGPDGKMVNIFDGERYTLLNIWATWCTPCIKEMPALRRINRLLAYEDKWRVIAVSIDKPSDMEKVVDFTNRLKVRDFAMFMDVNKQVQKNINIKGLPMTLVVNKKGKILYEFYGDVLWTDSNIMLFLRHMDLAR